MNVRNIFANRLKCLREEKELTQAELAQEVGISRGSVSYYESESRTPDIEILAALSRYFGVTADYLLGLTDNRVPENYMVGKELGLSDKSIDVIKNIDSIWRDDFVPAPQFIENSITKTKLLNTFIQHPSFVALMNQFYNAYVYFHNNFDIEKADNIHFEEIIAAEKLLSAVAIGTMDFGQMAVWYGIQARDYFHKIIYDIVFCDEQEWENGDD